MKEYNIMSEYSQYVVRKANIDNTKPIVANGTPKKSKALSSNISKIRRFYIVFASNFLSPDQINDISTLKDIIGYLNERKEKVEQKSHDKIDSMTEKYTNKIESYEKGSKKAKSAKNKYDMDVDRENEYTKNILDSIDGRIDNYNKRIQDIADEEKSKEQELPTEEIKEQKVSTEINDQVLVDSEMAKQKEITSNSVSEMTKDQKDLARFKEYIDFANGNKSKTEDQDLEPISPISSMESTEVANETTLNEINNDDQIKSDNSISSTESLQSEEDKQVEEPKLEQTAEVVLAEPQLDPIVPQSDNLNIQPSEQTNIELKGIGVNDEMINQIIGIINNHMSNVEKQYLEASNAKINDMSRKTEELLKEADRRLRTTDALRAQEKIERDQFEAHYLQSVETIKEKDNTIKSKDEEIESLKAELQKANATISEQQQKEEKLQGELQNRDIVIDRYKSVVKAFAEQGIAPVMPQEETTTKQM